MPIIRPEDGKPKVIYVPETPLIITGIDEAHEKVAQHQESDFDPIPDIPAPNFYEADRGLVSVYMDQETDVELLLARDGKTLTIRVGTDRLELSGWEWRGLYSGILNVGPGRGE